MATSPLMRCVALVGRLRHASAPRLGSRSSGLVVDEAEQAHTGLLWSHQPHRMCLPQATVQACLARIRSGVSRGGQGLSTGSRTNLCKLKLTAHASLQNLPAQQHALGVAGDS